MKCVQLVFSPTGGTKKVSEAITGAWGGAVETVDLTNAALDFSGIEFQKEDLVLISVPSFGGRVPGLAAERIGMVHGNGACCVLVCVYGNRAYEDTLVELSDIAGKGGFRVLSAVAAVAEHSIMQPAGRTARIYSSCAIFPGKSWRSSGRRLIHSRWWCFPGTVRIKNRAGQ